MKLLRADHLGFCFGVRDALTLAQTEAQRTPVTVLGDLVHNQTVLADLRERGIRLERELSAVTTDTVMITAHGTSERRLAEVRARGHHIIEATCPLVRHAHESLATLVKQGCHPVVIGQKGHVEVVGLTGDFDGCDVVLSEADIDALPARPCFGVVSQTTQPVARVRALVDYLRRRFPQSEVRFRDTVCQPTKQRQSAAESLARRCDVVVVIGGAQSNNTRELVATCQRHCRRVHHVQLAADLRRDWFHPDDTVGVTAGTSTPDSVIAGVELTLQRFAEAWESPRVPVSTLPQPEFAVA
ncbi:MAG: 4-hydroxy-3-methylbut-2-enyl diphosphate reductase [Verrucomicrobia bacterium]|nr:4-hydroxy-3-methylbut-2-enyl diphosphate reductase [Verrucomicrobiota bacterium]